jgi:hypothetical protein
MVDFAIVEDYISRFKNLKVDILTSGGKGKVNPKYISVVLDNHFLAFKKFSIIFYSIPFFNPNLTSPTLEDIFCNLI